MEVWLSNKSEEVPKAPRPEVTKTYERWKGLVFNSHGEKVAKPSSSTKQGSTAKDNYTTKHEFEFIYLEVKGCTSILQQTIREKDYQIKKLTINMETEKYVISFLE